MATMHLKRTQATLTDGSAYDVPYWEVDSGAPGPCVLVTTAMHGMELQGSEALRRFLPLVTDQLVEGSCLLLPFANPETVRRRQHHIDFDFRLPGGRESEDHIISVNSAWPGDAGGTNAERLAYALFHAVVQRATCLIDIHCWQRRQAATGLAREGRQDSVDLVNAAGTPFGRRSEWKPEIQERPVTPCTLTSYFHDTDRTAMCVELSGQYGFWPDQVELGLRILCNSFRHWGMLPGDIERPARPTVWLNDCDEMEVAAPAAGVFVPQPLAPTDWVEKGAGLGHIFVPATLETTEVLAPAEGCLFRFGPMHDHDFQHVRMFFHPHVEVGQSVALLARPKSR